MREILAANLEQPSSLSFVRLAPLAKPDGVDVLRTVDGGHSSRQGEESGAVLQRMSIVYSRGLSGCKRTGQNK